VQREIKIPNDSVHLAEVRSVVLDLASHTSIEAQLAQLLALAVDEAVANVMEHAFEGLPPIDLDKSKIEIFLESDGKSFKVRIRNQGKHFKPQMNLDLDIRQHVKLGKKGGLGLFLIRKIMDEVQYSFLAGSHNELVMVKYIDKA
jgi:serine/threonine-protein kinase RsbW